MFPADLDLPEFNATGHEDGSRFVVTIRGCLDMDATPHFTRYLDRIRIALVAHDVRKIEFDCRDLFLMSSSAISMFSRLADSMEQHAMNCGLTFLVNPKLRWQERSLEPVRRIAVGRVSIEFG